MKYKYTEKKQIKSKYIRVVMKITLKTTQQPNRKEMHHNNESVNYRKVCSNKHKGNKGFTTSTAPASISLVYT